jgi:putative ABC transport system permease protein
LASAMVAGLRAITPPFALPSEANIRIDLRVLLFTLAISVLTGIVFGLAPAMQAANPKLAETMKEGGRGTTTGGARGRLRSALVITETALAFILLTGAGLLIRSFDQLMNVRTGFDTTNVLTMSVPLSPIKIKDADQAVQYTQRVMDAAGALPGIREVSITSALPLQGWGYGMPFQIAGKPFKDRANRDACAFKMVSPSYFHSLGIALTRGRGLNERDRKGSLPVAVINETMVKRFFKTENPVGRRIEVQEIVYGKPNLGPEIPWEIVGVIADEKLAGLDDDRSPAMYVPFSQSPSQFASMIVKGETNPETMQQTIIHTVQQIDRDQPLPDIRTLVRIKTESVGPNRLRTALMAVFAGIAMLLAAIGIYGVISYSVAQRTHEMGLRSALGASAGTILRLVIGGGMARVAVGLAIGVAGALALARAMKSLLFGVGAADPWTIVSVALGLTVVAVLACYVPARRATRVDPMVALRYE